MRMGSKRQLQSNSDDCINYKGLLFDELNSIRNLGDYAYGSKLPDTLSLPAISIQNVGRLGYPLSLQQARALIENSRQAPFGKNHDTIVDLSVRKTWEIDSSQVQVDDKWLTQKLPLLLEKISINLGLDTSSTQIEAKLYKLLLYESGGHFKLHQDTEKEKGMFGSLIIQLPAEHEGGDMIIEHNGESKRFSFSRESAEMSYFTSFYADCHHSIEPILSGYRLVLAFNLILSGETTVALKPMSQGKIINDYHEVINGWLSYKNCMKPTKLVYLLDHEYSQTNLLFNRLKGRDRLVVELLKNIRKDNHQLESAFEVAVGIFQKNIVSEGEDGDRFPLINLKLIKLVSDCYIRELNVDLNDVMHHIEDTEDIEEFDGEPPNTSLWDVKKFVLFQSKSTGFQGNEGGSAEYFYHKAVVVFWPKEYTKINFMRSLPSNEMKEFYLDKDNHIDQNDYVIARMSALIASRKAHILQDASLNCYNDPSEMFKTINEMIETCENSYEFNTFLSFLVTLILSFRRIRFTKENLFDNLFKGINKVEWSNITKENQKGIKEMYLKSYPEKNVTLAPFPFKSETE